MLITVLKSKLHHLRVTQANLEYQGSLTIDEDLMDAAGLICFEKVLVAVVENGNRLETYAIPGPRGSGVGCLNGAAAHCAKLGDRLIVMAFGQVKAADIAQHPAKIVVLDEHNRILKQGY